MRHHETSERTTRAPGRRHHTDPTDEYPERSEGRPEQADRPQSGRPTHDQSRPGVPGGPPPPLAESPQVPAQRMPLAHPPAMPQIPPTDPAPAAHGGHARHAAGADAEGIPDLLGPAEEGEFRRRWHEVQGRFVDDPRQAVHAADVLVGDVMRTLADTFARHRHTLEGQWSQGLEADTESLRLALCQYRALFQRLLST
ncbi:hypothetical protein ACFU5Y_26325 [Streptomyces gardneri]|uniref:hypothetical protein n=1 Tax=Streptomyces gardneri TaxID=66892 RepID=UPI0036A1B20B